MTEGSLQFRTAAGCQFGNCVKVGFGDGAVFLGDTKRMDDTLIEFSGADWTAFVGQIKQGSLDLDRLGPL